MTRPAWYQDKPLDRFGPAWTEPPESDELPDDVTPGMLEHLEHEILDSAAKLELLVPVWIRFTQATVKGYDAGETALTEIQAAVRTLRELARETS